jgi:hypothetical protein
MPRSEKPHLGTEVLAQHAGETSQGGRCRKAALLSDHEAFLSCAALADELFRVENAALSAFLLRWRTAAYDLNFSISAIAAAGARTLPSWMK